MMRLGLGGELGGRGVEGREARCRYSGVGTGMGRAGGRGLWWWGGLYGSWNGRGWREL